MTARVLIPLAIAVPTFALVVFAVALALGGRLADKREHDEALWDEAYQAGFQAGRSSNVRILRPPFVAGR